MSSNVLLFVLLGAVGFAAGYAIAFRDTRTRERDLDRRAAATTQELAQQEASLSAKTAASIAEIQAQRDALEAYRRAWQEEYSRLIEETRDLYRALERGFLHGRAWLANAFAEYLQMQDRELECALVLKPNPAFRAAETVAALRRERFAMARQLKMLQYQVASYEEYFPVLADYRDSILDEVVDLRDDAEANLADVDPALGLGYLSKDEYEGLPAAEKFQRALDRYWERDKSKVEIGRVYERYVGYLYEREGWAVRYHGALKGFEDFGRDLICTRGEATVIVQCKCWSRNKVIREKHVMQLYGTCILHQLTGGGRATTPVLATTTALSEEAAMVAAELNVLVSSLPLQRYPMVKCNVSSRTGERIYHLPFDQQYDRVVVGDQPGECYVATIAEAEAGGFRRAYRWQAGGPA